MAWWWYDSYFSFGLKIPIIKAHNFKTLACILLTTEERTEVFNLWVHYPGIRKMNQPNRSLTRVISFFFPL